MPHSSDALAALVTSFVKLKTIKFVPDPKDLQAFNDAKKDAVPAPSLDDVWNNGEAMPDPPSGRPPPCPRGTDFGQPCPEGWTESFMSCRPPQGYVFSPACLQQTGGKNSFSSYLKADKKRKIELACSVGWPCAQQKFGMVPDYDRVCPVHWINQPDGSCAADKSYDGPCKRIQNFLKFSDGMKATWAANCGASWPLALAKEPKIPGPLPDRSEPSEAVWARCGRDYNFECPVTFRLDENGMCRAPDVYDFKGIGNCASFDSHRWTPEMKEAFEKSCHVAWPCKGEIIQFSSAALLGLTFL